MLISHDEIINCVIKTGQGEYKSCKKRIIRAKIIYTFHAQRDLFMFLPRNNNNNKKNLGWGSFVVKETGKGILSTTNIFIQNYPEEAKTTVKGQKRKMRPETSVQ